MTATDAEKNGADHHITRLLSSHKGVIQAGLHFGKVNDLTFPHAARWGRADTENFDRAVTLCLTDDDADFARTDF